MAIDDMEAEEVYDPDQDPEATRDIRRRYRAVAAEVQDPQDISTEDVANALRTVDNLFTEVRAVGEATNDSSLLLQISQIGAAKARAMKSGSGGFDVDDLVARLITYMGGRKPVSSPVGGNGGEGSDDDDEEYDAGNAPLDWERIGRRALAKSRRVPAMDFMCVGSKTGDEDVNEALVERRLGPLSIEQKKRMAAKRVKLEKNEGDMKKPQEITEEDITRSENETTKNVATLERILSGMDGQPINLFKFTVNPRDFGQSVENLFYLSFLIRDGKCAFYMDEDTGEPVILLCEQPTQEDYRDGLVKHQLVMEFDMKTWQRAIEVFNITEPMIPQRPKSEMRIGKKWYG